MQQQVSPTYQKPIVITLFLISGIVSTFAYKLQTNSKVDEGDHHNKNFFHPYIQSLTMFIGQFLCIFIYFYMRVQQRRKQKSQNPLLQVNDEQQPKKKHTPLIFILPACADATSSVLQYMGLSFISGSTYLMFKGTSLVTTAIFSKILVHMVVQKRHLAGCGLAVLGITIVGSSGFVDTSSGGQSIFAKEFAGYILMLISLIFNGFFYAYQQRLLKQYKDINPLQMVGFQGLFGICIISTVILIASFIPCDLGERNCVYTSDGNGYFERFQVYLRQVFDSWFLVIMVVLGIITISVYNLNGLRITKLLDALTRSLLNVTKTGFVWVVGIIITLIAGSDEQFKMQSLNIWVNLIKAAGFTSIVFGTLIYNKLIFTKYFADVQTEKKQGSLMVTDQNISPEKSDDGEEK